MRLLNVLCIITFWYMYMQFLNLNSCQYNSAVVGLKNVFFSLLYIISEP